MKQAEQRLHAFLDAWKKKDYEFMYEAAQLTWKDTNGLGDLAMMFKDLRPKKIKVLSTTMISQSSYRYGIEIEYVDGSKTISGANVICEVGPYLPRVFGTWGVNPASILKSTVVTEAKAKRVRTKPNKK